jgi:hypothetical protein
MIMSMESPGDTIVENNKLRARRERSLRNIPSIASKNIESITTHCDMRIAIKIKSSIRITRDRTTEKPVNFPKIIMPLRIGFESIR